MLTGDDPYGAVNPAAGSGVAREAGGPEEDGEGGPNLNGGLGAAL